METKIKSTNFEDLCKDPRNLKKFFILKNVSVSIPGECPYCNQHFTDLKTHLKPPKRETIPRGMILTNFDCNFCQLVLPNEECIRNHQENVHGGNSRKRSLVPCKTCHIIFSSTKNLKFHSALCHGELTETPSNDSLNKSASNNVIKMQECKTCGKKFTNFNIKKHLAEEHPQKQEIQKSEPEVEKIVPKPVHQVQSKKFRKINIKKEIKEDSDDDKTIQNIDAGEDLEKDIPIKNLKGVAAPNSTIHHEKTKNVKIPIKKRKSEVMTATDENITSSKKDVVSINAKKALKSVINRQKSREIVCHDCRKVFATRDLKTLHTCNSILDRNISEDGQDRPNRAIKRLDRGTLVESQDRKKQKVEQKFLNHKKVKKSEGDDDLKKHQIILPPPPPQKQNNENNTTSDLEIKKLKSQFSFEHDKNHIKIEKDENKTNSNLEIKKLKFQIEKQNKEKIQYQKRIQQLTTRNETLANENTKLAEEKSELISKLEMVKKVIDM